MLYMEQRSTMPKQKQNLQELHETLESVVSRKI